MRAIYNHHVNANATWYSALNDTPGVGPPIEPPPGDVRQYWRDWMDRDGFPFWSWSDVLTADEKAEYEARAVKELGPECARWLATGEGAN